MAWSWLGSPADIRSCSRYYQTSTYSPLFFVTYRFLLHLEQPRKPKLCEKLQQEIPEVLRQELADLHGDGDGEGDGDGDGQSSLIIEMVMVMEYCDDNSEVLRENWLTFTSDGDGDSERDVDVDDGEVLR